MTQEHIKFGAIMKLAFENLRQNYKKYSILFLGLLVLSTLIYTFSTLTKTLGTNQTLIMTQDAPVFITGEVVLIMITMIYMGYLNRFLLNQAQQNKQLTQRLGDKQSKVIMVALVQLLMISISMVFLGVLVGIAVSQLVGFSIASTQGVVLKGFVGFHLLSLIDLILVFVGLPIVGLIVNKVHISGIMPKIHKEESRKYRNPWLVVVQLGLGVIGFLVAYYASHDILNYQTQSLALIITSVAILSGVYCVFNAFYPTVIQLLLKWPWFSKRKLHENTLNQLNTKLIHHVKGFSLVTLLLAVAVGAIAVTNSVTTVSIERANDNTFYDTVIYNHQPEVTEAVKQLPIEEKTTYHYKVDGKNVYMLKNELETQQLKLKVVDFGQPLINGNRLRYKTTSYQGENAKAELKHTISSSYELIQPDNDIWINTFELPTDVTYQDMSQSEFDQVQATSNEIQLIKTKGGIAQNWPALMAIEKLQLGDKMGNDRVGGMRNSQVGGQGITYFRNLSTEFAILKTFAIGISLALLITIISILIFKQWQSFKQDKATYQTMQTQGFQPSVIKKALFKEVLALFIMPLIPGVITTLIGLEVFNYLTVNIYQLSILPITICVVLYLVIAVLVAFVYQKKLLKTAD
ncbi:FtsX-like permease family protein [Holzapfeliella sp. He02]|uniref:FtsX-like permease family protein n=1 Tax=Holzapfeliella saturejae TaxID=3082953 RepID=A0ABU8SE97_9LACO